MSYEIPTCSLFGNHNIKPRQLVRRHYLKRLIVKGLNSCIEISHEINERGDAANLTLSM